MADSKLNPPKYKTFIPDQYKVGAQVEGITAPRFYENSKIGKSELGTSEYTSKTLGFIRDLLTSNS